MDIREKKISVIGLGYVGLPLAMLAINKGFKVEGIDKNATVVKEINNANYHIQMDFLKKFPKVNNIEAKQSLENSDSYIICVPTPVNDSKYPDLSYVISATKEIASVIKDGELVIIESTIYPGVCEDIIKPLLDETKKEYHLAHCPERINPGDKKWDVSNIPRVIGGLTKECATKAEQFYSQIIDAEVITLTNIRAAEATKILENTFRDVNIAFVNEMAQSFHMLGIDVAEVIKGASTKPFGFLAHYPGCGVGGHCIAVDPYYMIEKGKEIGFEHNFLTQARKINSSMPEFTISLLQEELNKLSMPIKGTKIGLLGISYKPNVGDDRESPYYAILGLLKEKGAKTLSYDPYFKDTSTSDSLKEIIDFSDAVIIVTAHEEFLNEELYNNLKLIIDGRNCLNKKKITTKYVGIGTQN